MIVKATQLLFCLLTVLVSQSAIAANSSVFLEDLTWTELHTQIGEGKTTIIIPIGGTEQSGPFMALGKHNVRAKVLSERIAQRLGNALVAPVIAYVPEGSISPPTAHMKFPGTITISDDVFEKMLDSAARSFQAHGFLNIVFLGDHGGYQADLKIVADRLNKAWASTSAHAYALSEYYKTTQTEYVQELKKRGFNDAEIGTHAGLADTSLMLAVDPQLVRLDALHASAKIPASQGVYGDPRRATTELGQIGINEVIEHSVEAIKKATTRN